MQQLAQIHRPAAMKAWPSAVTDGWDPLLICIGGFILTSVGRVHQLFPVLAPIRPALVTGALAVILLLVDRSPQRGMRGPNAAAGWLLALAAWMALSVPLALWPAGALQTWLDFAKTAAIYFVLVGAVRSARDVERLAFVYFLGAALFAITVLTRFELGDSGRLGSLYYYDANDFATFATTALPLGLYFALSHPRGLVRVLIWGGISALAVAFAWSGSRGGFLALFAVAAYVLFRSTTIPRRWRVASIFGITALTALTASETYWAQLRTLVRPAEDYNLTSDEGRLRIWRRGMGYVSRHPVLGVGAGNFATAEGTISPLAERGHRGRPLKWGPPHNSYVQVAAELGIPGFLLFGGFLASVFISLRRLSATGTHSRLAQSLTAALTGFAVGAFFLTLAYYEMLYTLAALAAALRKVSTLAAPPAPAPGLRPVRPAVTAWLRGRAWY